MSPRELRDDGLREWALVARREAATAVLALDLAERVFGVLEEHPVSHDLLELLGASEHDRVEDGLRRRDGPLGKLSEHVLPDGVAPWALRGAGVSKA